MGDKKDKKNKKNKEADNGVLEVIKKDEKKKKRNLGESGKVDFEAMREIERTTTRLNVSCGQYGAYPYSMHENKKKTSVNISLDVPSGLSAREVYNTSAVQDRINTQLDAWDAGKLDSDCSVENISYGATLPYEVIQNAISKNSRNIIDSTYQEIAEETADALTDSLLSKKYSGHKGNLVADDRDDVVLGPGQPIPEGVFTQLKK